MPVLENPKHERFCHLVIEGARKGLSQGAIYELAGYKARGHSAEQLGSQLLKNVEIQQRIAELSAPAVRKTQITAESLLNTLEANILAATEKGQHGAVNGSVALMAQLRGLLIDRVEVGEAGEFAGCTTVDQIVDKWLEADDPAETLAFVDELRELLVERLAHRATLISPDVGVSVGIRSKWQRESQ